MPISLSLSCGRSWFARLQGCIKLLAWHVLRAEITPANPDPAAPCRPSSRVDQDAAPVFLGVGVEVLRPDHHVRPVLHEANIVGRLQRQGSPLQVFCPARPAPVLRLVLIDALGDPLQVKLIGRVGYLDQRVDPQHEQQCVDDDHDGDSDQGHAPLACHLHFPVLTLSGGYFLQASSKCGRKSSTGLPTPSSLSLSLPPPRLMATTS